MLVLSPQVALYNYSSRSRAQQSFGLLTLTESNRVFEKAKTEHNYNLAFTTRGR